MKIPLFAALLAWLGGFALFTDGLPRPPPVLERAEGIVVFTGGSRRVLEGVELLERGLAPRLLVSGVPRGASLSSFGLSQRRARALEARVTLGFEATDTYTNAEETAAWVARHGVQRLILVTSDYHMDRSLMELRRTLPDGVIVTPYPVRARTMQGEGWFLRPGVLWIVFREYNKTLLVKLRRVFLP